ncbi:hypothetical protein [Pseudoxanthomonas suwonensis]
MRAHSQRRPFAGQQAVADVKVDATHQLLRTRRTVHFPRVEHLHRVGIERMQLELA